MIRITPENTAALEAILKQANGNAIEHAFTTFAEIDEIARRAERHLEDFGLPLRSRVGAEWVETSGQQVSGRYRYSRRATTIHLLRRAAGWYLAQAVQTVIYQWPGKAEKIRVTKAQEVEILKRVRAKYSVISETSDQ